MQPRRRLFLFIGTALVLLIGGQAWLPAQTSTGSAANGDETGPILFFSKSDLPALQEKAHEPAYAQLWSDALTEARGYCDPKSPTYVDPNIYSGPLAKGDEFGAMTYSRPFCKWMDAIGFAYQLTGDKALGEHGAAILEQVARHLPVSNPIMSGGEAPPYGDMMRALATGLDLLSDALTPEQRAVVVDTARGYILQHLHDYNAPESMWRTIRVPHNFTGVTGGGMGVLAIALRNDYPQEVPGWIKVASEMCNNWLQAGFDRQGAYFEGVLYMGYGLGNPFVYADALHRYNGDTALMQSLGSKGISQFLAQERLPADFDFDARNDSIYPIDFTGGPIGSPFLLALASGFNGVIQPDPLASWLWQNARPKTTEKWLQILWDDHAPARAPAAVLPKPYGAYYADRGLCIWRTGWDRNDTMFSIEAGPFHPVTHNQADKGHFTFYSSGDRWAADCGYGNNQEPQGRAQTVDHSCVLIDGKGQALTGAGLGTDGKVLDYENTDSDGYALVDSKSAYNIDSAGRVGVPLTKSLRHVFFLRPRADSPAVPAYAVVLDDVEMNGESHRFTWQMITWQDMKIQTGENDSFVITSRDGKRKMAVLLAASQSLSLSSAPFHADDHPGRGPNDYQRLRADTQADNPHFVAVLAPLPDQGAPPTLSVEDSPDGKVIKIDWPARVDTILWNGDKATLQN